MEAVSGLLETVDVVVIGGGLAGLSCANSDELIDKKMVILEAQNRIGGRVHPVSGGWHQSVFPGMEIDLGAEFVHGNDNCLLDFAREENWKVKPNFVWAHGDGGPNEETAPDGGAGYYYVKNRLQRFDELDEDLNELRKELDEMSVVKHPVEKSDWSLAKYFDGLSDAAKSLAEAGYANTLCSSLSDLNLLLSARLENLWVENDGECFDFRLIPSNRLVLERFNRQLSAKNVDIRTGSRVVSILNSDNADNIVVTYQSDGPTEYKISARRVLVTVPVSVLQGRGGENETIQFIPSLPKSKIDAISGIGMGGALKIIAKFSKRFWPEDLHGLICADCTIPEIWSRDVGLFTAAKDDQRSTQEVPYYCLVGFAAGSFADKLASTSDQSIINLFISQLDKMFGDECASAAFLGGFVYNWSKVPYIRGGYSYPGMTETNEAREIYARPEYGGKLFFAGEATDYLGGYMTMTSAISTGSRAAREIAQSL